MKGVDAARFAEVVLRRTRVELIKRQRVFPGRKFEMLWIDSHHHGAFALAKAAITPKGRRERASDLKRHRSAVTRTFVGFQFILHKRIVSAA
jgi:hypothetical protein